MSTKIRRKALAVSMAGAMLLSVITPVPFSTPVQAAPAVTAPAQVTADWYKTYQTMDGVGAAYAYTDSIHMMQLATAGHQDKVRHLLDLTFSEEEGTGHDIVRVIIGDNGGLTASGATSASPGFNPLTGLLADVSNPGFDVEGTAIPMRGTAGQYGYKIEAENRYYDGNTDSIWPVEPEHAPGTLVPVQDFVWDYPSWNQPIRNDDGGPTNLLSTPGEDPVVIKNSPRTRKELFDLDQVWTMRQAMQYDVKQFYACTWTVPYWMSQSSTNSPHKIIRGDTATIDGKPVKIYYQAYADYLVNYIRGMWEQWGIPITHINPFNEVDLAGANAAYVTELINGYIGPTLKKSMQPGGALYDIQNPDGKLIDFIPLLAAVDGTNLSASLSRGGEVFSQTDPDNALDKNPYLDLFTTHLYGTVGIGTDENKLYHTGDFSQSPLDYSKDGSKYPEYLTKYKLWQAEFMNQDTADGSAGAYTQRYGNQNINDAVRWSNLMTNMFSSNPGFNGFVWWSMWDSNGADGSDLIRFVSTNSQQEPGRISTLTGEYRLFKRFYGYGHFSRFMNPGDVRFDVTRVPATDINVVGFKNPNTNDFSLTVSNAKNDDSIQPLEFSLKDFPAGTSSVTVFRTSGSENQKKLSTIPVANGKFVIDIPSASIVTIVPSQGTFATYNGLDGERDIFSTLEAEGNDNGMPGDSAGNAGRTNEAVSLDDGEYLAYKNLNFADGSANGGVVRRHLLYLTAQTKSAQGGKLTAYVLPLGTIVSSNADVLSKGTRVAEITVPSNDGYGKFQDMVDTGDLSAYGHKDLYIVAETNGSNGNIIVDRFLFGANDSDWSMAANNSTVSIPGNILLNGDFDTTVSSNTDHWSTGRYNKGNFELSVTESALTADTIQSYSGLSRYLKNTSTSKVAGSGKISGRIEAADQYDGMWQDVTGKLNNGDSYNFKGYFLSMKSRPESYDIAAENPGDVEAALVYYDKDGNQLGITSINGRDMPEPYAAREAGDPAYWSNGKLIGRILEGGPISLSSFQPVDVKVADWHETPNQPFTYDEPVGTDKVVMAVYAKDANILYADQLSLTPQFVASYSIFIDGVQPSNFDATRHEYTYTVSGNAIPKITAVSNDPAEQISISQANSAQGTAVVRFIKGDTVKTYKISFSTNVVIDFAHGLPAGWEVMSPANPENALSYSAEGATIKTLKGDTEYPNSHNILQFPGSAEGNWTLTAKLTVDKPLNDSSMGENSQVGIGISRISSGEFYRINARKVSTNIKVNNSGKTGNTPFTNNTNQTNLNGTNYYLRIIKEGNIVQGYFSTNSGSTWTAMGSPSTYTQDFFKDAKVQLYGTNTSASTDFSVTFSNVTQIKTLGEAGEVNKDQRSVEEAAALISNRITVPNAAGDDVDTLKSKAQEYLNNHEALKELGVTTSISYQNGVFMLIISKGTASVTINPLTIVADVKSTRDFEDQTAQGFKSKGSAGVILTPTQEANHTPGGAYALKITGRTANSDGPTVHLKDAVKVGNEYKAAVWVKLIGPDSAQLKLSALVNTQTPYSITLATQPASSTGDWVKLEGSYRYLNDDVSLVVETVDSATASYYIDDFSFENTNSEPTPSIKDVYKDYFKITNIPGNTAFLNSGTAENAFYNYHFDGVTIGNQLKPDALQKNKGIFTFGTADSMIAKAQSQGQDIHGHVLVWHSQTPAWFNQQVDASGNALKDETGNPIYLSRDEALTNMRTHIKTVMEHYEGIPESWDVVNEAMADAPDPVNDWKEALRKSAWYYSVGPDFIEQAFFAAREVLNNHPEWGDVKLYYNDFNEDFPAKRDAIYDMVKELNDRYASTHPGMLLIDGIGMQSHYDMRTIPANVEASLEKFASLGVKVAISELDVLAGMNSSLSSEMAERQGSLYAQLFQIYKKHADKISNVTIWGPYDTTSWRVTQNPCLFDGNLNPKPAYYAVINPEKYLAEHPLYTAPESKSTTALYGTPDIDGTVDDIWEEAPEIQIDNHLMATAETSGTAKTLWDEENLYVLFQVKDTELSRDNVDKTKQDSVEAYVDEDRINAWPYREDDGEYRVNFAGEQSFKFLSNSTPPTSPGFESAAITAGTDYRVEMKIPFKTITPENGTQIRFDAQINNAKGATLVGVATWNDLLGRATKSTEVLGGLTLIGKGDPTPPVWAEGSKLEASDITSTGVTLSWPAATHKLGVSSYRIYNGIDEEPITVTGGVYRHQLQNGLMPNTQYTFKVEAGDASGNWSTNGPSVSVTTLPTSDIMPPVWGEESTIEASDITSTGLTLTWSATATDESGISGYKIINGVDDKPITVTNAVYMNTVTGAVYSYQVDGLTSDTHYTFKVEAGDTAGNWSTSGPSVTATTLPVLDTASPEWPEGSKLESSHVTTERLTLTWTAATDDTAVTVYKIYKGSEQIAVLPGTTFQYDVSGLTSSTRYEFTIQAGDASGNWSTDGPKNLVTTLRSNGGPSVPVPTPTPTVTPTPLPGGTPSPTLTPTPTPTPTPPSNFKDVGSKYNWAIKAIDTLYGLDIIKGTSETTFSPEKNITRADFVLLLVRALGLKAETDSNFADVSQGAYYYEAIRIAKKLGIINGVDGNNFNPKGEISRQDMMVMVARALKTVNKLSSSNSAESLNVYEDASKIAFYAKANIATLVKEGIIQGDGKYINPTGTATRAEAAVIIYNIYDK